ncbi:MAG: hypothetical protein VB050_17660 [Geobacteraceae bacterium]|nr:hypothetical protein [Geobacteraceae bacterium]
MSSILKALKKLEQSKAVRRESDHDMTWFVRGEPPEPAARRRYWPMAMALVSVAAAAVFGTYMVMMKFSAPPGHDAAARATDVKGTASAVATPRDTAAVVAAPPAKAVASPAPSETKTAAVPENLQSSATKSRGKVKLPPGKATARPKPVLDANQGNMALGGSARLKSRKTEAPRINHSPAPEPSAAREHPSLHVGGIAWQKDSSSPMAIVNGTPVAEGSTVSGARVEKIYQERVRFSYQGRSFDVGLGASSSNR